MSNISPAAHVDPKAEVASDVTIGPFTFVGPDVIIGPGTKIENNVSISGRTTIGCDNHIFPGAVLGGPPQDLSYAGADTQLTIGDGNTIREGVTVNCGTEKDEGITRIGSQNYLMANSHVAHDCQLGNKIVMANGTLLAGHVHVNDHVTLSGNCAVHHFATIGAYSFVGGLSRVTCDIPPYMLCEGAPARPRCINVVALKRNDFPQAAIKALSEAHRLLYRGKIGAEAAREILASSGKLLPEVDHLLTFLESQSAGRHGRGRDIRKIAA